MKIVFYDTKPYDRESFERCNGNYPDIEVEYEDADLTEKTAMLARGADAVCAFVNSNLSAGVIDRLADEKVKEATDGKNIIKQIYVPNKLVNIVAK